MSMFMLSIFLFIVLVFASFLGNSNRHQGGATYISRMLILVIVFSGYFLYNNQLSSDLDSCYELPSTVISSEKIPFSNGLKGYDYKYKVVKQYEFNGEIGRVSGVVRNVNISKVCYNLNNGEIEILDEAVKSSSLLIWAINLIIVFSVVFIINIIKARRFD